MPNLIETCVIVLVVGLFIALGKSVDMNVWLLAVGSGVAAALAALVIEAVSKLMEKMDASDRSLKAAAEEIRRLREGETSSQKQEPIEECDPQQNVLAAALEQPPTKKLTARTTSRQSIAGKASTGTRLQDQAMNDQTNQSLQTLPGAQQGSGCEQLQQPSQELPTGRQIAKQGTLRDAVKIPLFSGRPAQYKLQMKKEYENENKQVRRLSYGPSDSTKPMKTILVVGATGAGKSTLINALANHLLGVDFEDDYRFRIVEEDPDADQANSQTKWVTAYVFYHHDTFPENFPCNLTIVDTPGFGDTRGIQEDEKIKDQLSHFFHGQGIEGIDALDAIGFVIQSSLPRLTPTQQYIFHSILAIFGKDIEDNIFILATFADGQKPPVIDAVKADKLPHTNFFKFNNSALFAKCDSEGDDEVPFDKFFWQMGAASYDKFLKHVSQATTKSLSLTKEVLNERERLQARVSDLQRQIKMAFATSENLRAALDCFLQHQTDIDRNKDFSFEVKKPKIVTIRLEKGEYVTNCLKCNITCHYPCKLPDNDDKWGCAAMNWPEKGENSTCTICVSGCGWRQHKNTRERFEVTDEVETQTVQEMKAKYEEACQEQLSTEDVIIKIIEDIEFAETEIVSLVEEVRRSLERLSEIALRPDHMTTSGYIDILIKSEKQQAKPGWQKRVDQLETVRERAELINSYAKFHGISEPFQALKKEILDMKTEREAGRLKEGGMIQSIKNWRDTAVNWGKKAWESYTSPRKSYTSPPNVSRRKSQKPGSVGHGVSKKC